MSILFTLAAIGAAWAIHATINKIIQATLKEKPSPFREHAGPIDPGPTVIKNNTGRPEYVIEFDEETP